MRRPAEGSMRGAEGVRHELAYQAFCLPLSAPRILPPASRMLSSASWLLAPASTLTFQAPRAARPSHIPHGPHAPHFSRLNPTAFRIILPTVMSRIETPVFRFPSSCFLPRLSVVTPHAPHAHHAPRRTPSRPTPYAPHICHTLRASCTSRIPCTSHVSHLTRLMQRTHLTHPTHLNQLTHRTHPTPHANQATSQTSHTSRPPLPALRNKPRVIRLTTLASRSRLTFHVPRLAFDASRLAPYAPLSRIVPHSHALCASRTSPYSRTPFISTNLRHTRI